MELLENSELRVPITKIENRIMEKFGLKIKPGWKKIEKESLR